MGNDVEVEALLRPIPNEKNILSWIEDAIDSAMRKLPDGALGRAGVSSEVAQLKNAIEELWLDSKNLPKQWILSLEKSLEAASLDAILERYRKTGEWELQYRIDEAEVFIHAY